MGAGKFGRSLILAFVCVAISLPAVGQVGVGGFGSHVATRGVPASVTSFGFGGHPGWRNTPPSVTSLGFGNSGFRGNQAFGGHRSFRGDRSFTTHRRRNEFVSPFFGNVVAVPYAYPGYLGDYGPDNYADEDDYSGGPTVFDRRGSGEDDYRRPDSRADEYRNNADEVPGRQQSADEPTPQDHTVLVFKDGHQTEVLNYAIVGSTLFDLSDGRAKKVALNDLDLSATVKQNDERGVEFKVPATVD